MQDGIIPIRLQGMYCNKSESLANYVVYPFTLFKHRTTVARLEHADRAAAIVIVASDLSSVLPRPRKQNHYLTAQQLKAHSAQYQPVLDL